MSLARTARLLSPAEPPREQTVEQQARRVVKGLRPSVLSPNIGTQLDYAGALLCAVIFGVALAVQL